MKVFLTGANGMLGSSIVRALLSHGHAVKCLVKPGTENNNLNGLDIEVVYADLLDADAMGAAMKGCDAVVNAAASTQVYPRKNDLIWKINFEAVKMLAKLARANDIKRFVQIGTANSFPEGSKNQPGNEGNPYNGHRFGMDYIDSKYAAQEYLLQQYREHQFPVIVINPTYMIGPFDTGPTSGKMLQAFAQGKLPGYTNGGKSFVCSMDVAAAVANAMSLGKTGECYIAAGENLSYEEFFRKAAGILNVPFRLKKIPAPMVLGLGLISSAVARTTGKRPQLSYGMAKISGIGQYYSNQKIVSELQMVPTPIEEGMRDCLNWFRENNYLS